ncbi:MAG: ACT domain-containing protein [Proteobacteria bacterium]|nr:ACT domain-containing protein [Pseudomonadota bacterium]
MAGETDLGRLLGQLQPMLIEGEFVFCTLPNSQYGDFAEWRPLACYQEQEGLSLLISQQQADAAGLAYSAVFKGITLSVHSSLDAVGLTAAVANKLAECGIPANVIAAHYHDHVFVPAERAELALQLLSELST